MNRFCLLHLAYLLTLLGTIAWHALFPLYTEHVKRGQRRSLRDRYNRRVEELEMHLEEKDRRVLGQLREVVVYSQFVDLHSVEACVSSPLERADEIQTLYTTVENELRKPHKVFLRYSTDGNIGVLCSFLVPLVAISASNAKALYQ
ncbi:hypothetical protein NECID01_1969 [Nematocida sp. AWRm77]|nr:hypothetical protein NECID01_1969 [Nematocida sp. AWRm77]